MTITLEFLQQQLPAAEARQAQLMADLNGTIGEVRMLRSLIDAAAKPEPAQEPPATNPEPPTPSAPP